MKVINGNIVFENSNDNNVARSGTYTINIDPFKNEFTIVYNLKITSTNVNIGSGHHEQFIIRNKQDIQDNEFWSLNNDDHSFIDFYTPNELPPGESYTHTTTRTFKLKGDGTTGGDLRISKDSGTGLGKHLIDEIKISSIKIRVGGYWVNTAPFVKVSGVFKRCIMWKKINGVWKKGD